MTYKETIHFSLGTLKRRQFVDMRIFIKEDGKDPVPTPKGLAISPALWPQFKTALAKVEEAMFQAAWLDPEDLGELE
jgi:hypothetical protein